MSDKQPQQASTITQLGGRLIDALTPQFLALIVINGLFLMVFFWYVDARAKYANALIGQLLTACLKDHS